MIRLVCAFFVLLAIPACADDQLPWFGGEDQPAFQINREGQVVAGEFPEAVESVMAEACTIESCLKPKSSAKVPIASGVSP